MDQLKALLVLAGLGYFLYALWGILVLLVTAPRGALSAALAAAEIDEEEEDRQRRRRRREEDDKDLWGDDWIS